ncbi:hypothetical protein PINS_up006283 [Pythium insidiosum]|nr:hypothetical protein PINS_up006283 [Pythium insidiosum]
MDALVAAATPSEAPDSAGGQPEAQAAISTVDGSSLARVGAETEPSQEPNRVAHNADEYDPANPSGDGGDAHDGTEAQDTTLKRPHVNDANVKSEDGVSPLPAKRVRGAASTSPASPTSPASAASSSSTPRAVDKRGLSDSAWDRLMDLESCGEFRVSQVSRAAFSSIATLPEFAQCMVVARFARTPMTDVRDKNGLVMRVFHEYLRENPHIQSLQPVSTFIADAVSDPGLFAYGYAPPMPTTGISTVRVPYRFDKPEPAKTKATARAEKREAKDAKPGKHHTVDSCLAA